MEDVQATWWNYVPVLCYFSCHLIVVARGYHQVSRAVEFRYDAVNLSELCVSCISCSLNKSIQTIFCYQTHGNLDIYGE